MRQLMMTHQSQRLVTFDGMQDRSPCNFLSHPTLLLLLRCSSCALAPPMGGRVRRRRAVVGRCGGCGYGALVGSVFGVGG